MITELIKLGLDYLFDFVRDVRKFDKRAEILIRNGVSKGNAYTMFHLNVMIKERILLAKVQALNNRITIKEIERKGYRYIPSWDMYKDELETFIYDESDMIP